MEWCLVFRGTCDIMDGLAGEEGDFDSRISEWKMVHWCRYIKVWSFIRCGIICLWNHLLERKFQFGLVFFRDNWLCLLG
jgi:hypothetical protein